MKYRLLIFIIVLSTGYFIGQSKVDSLVRMGIQHHDNGAYDLAIEKYQEALKLDPISPLVNYEIAMTYMYKQEYNKAIEHCDIVLQQDDQFILETFITKGSCLDYLGKTDESIKLFKKALKKFGEHHLIYYNLAYDYYKIRDEKKAEEALINAININPNHSSSHLLLGYLMADQSLKTQSILCLHYFLFLEPESDRSAAAYDLLIEQFEGNVEKDASDPNQLTIYIDDDNPKSDFSSADLMLGMLEASKSLDKNKDKSEDEMFIENTTSFFKMLGEMNDDKKKGLWWEFYVPLFYDLAQSDYMDVYCYYISLSGNQNAGAWFLDNKDKVTAFANWLDTP